MKKAKVLSSLIVACCVAAWGILAEELPKQIVLRGDTVTGLYRNGKFSRTVRLKAGEVLPVVRFEKGNFVTEYEDGEVRIDRFNTELARTNMASLLRLTQITNSPVAPVAPANTPTPEWVCNKARFLAATGRDNLSQYFGDDVKAAQSLIDSAEAIVKAYESGETNRVLDLWKERVRLLDEVLKRSKINGYKYNEIVKGDVAVPVVFDLYSGGEDFYLQVGDGSFCTVATVPLQDWKLFLESATRVETWIATCRAKRLETRKELCTAGSSIFTFVSFDSGKMWYVMLKIRGSMRNDALVEEQTVKLTPLNYWRLYERMGQALQIAQRRLKEEEAAKQLQ